MGVFLDKLSLSIVLDEDIANTTIKCLKEFSTKYGETFFPEVMDEVKLKIAKNKDNIGYITGLILTIREIILELGGGVLKLYKDQFIAIIN
jgi:hypothetical protein